MRTIAACVSLWCVASVAHAQIDAELLPFEPSSLDYPDRAAALRPAGMVELSLAYAHGTAYEVGEWEEHLVFERVDVRVPYESVIFEASWTATFEHYAFGDTGVPLGTLDVFRHGNPRLGASWREPREHYRIEIGGAINLGFLYAESIDPAYLRPPVAGGLARHRGGWSWFQLAEGAVAIVPHVRIERDITPEIVVGTEIDLPIVIMVDQDEAAFLPQVAVEGAWRFLAYSMLGLRAQLVVLAYGSDRFGVATSLEPFLRIAHAGREIGWFVLLAGEVYLGPDHPFAPVDPRGSICPKLGGGLLF